MRRVILGMILAGALPAGGASTAPLPARSLPVGASMPEPAARTLETRRARSAFFGFFGGVAGLRPPANRVPADLPVFQYLGAWQEVAGGRSTIQPGSQVRFRLKGPARLVLEAGLPEGILVGIRRNGAEVWRGRLGSEVPSIDGGACGAEFSVTYLAAWHRRSELAPVDRGEGELVWAGLDLVGHGRLEARPVPQKIFRMDFIGDSITAGDGILGRTRDWGRNFDASLTFLFQLAELLQADYRIWAFGGARGEHLVSQLPTVPAEPGGVPPDLTFINVGANNRSTDSMQYRVLMSQLLRQVFSAHPQTRVVLLNFFRMTPNRLPILQELARTYLPGTVRCFDARACLVGYSDGGVHPDPESHARLAKALAAFVREEFPEAQRSLDPIASAHGDE